MQMKATMCFSLILLALSIGQAKAAPTYTQEWSLDASDSFGTSPESVTNAFIRHEAFSPFVQYWQPTTPNTWAEVVYKIDVPFTIASATTDINVNAYNGTDGGPNFDPDSLSYADVSTDGINYTNIMTAGYPGHAPAWTLPTPYGDISPLVAGASTIYIRSRMYMTVDYSGFNAAQFLRGAAGSPYNVTVIGVPEPSTIVLGLLGILGLTFFKRKKPSRFPD
jgi:hypothetical protein